MFETLSNKLQGVFQKLSGRGSLTEENIEEGLKEIRRALLEADVHFKVVKDFLEKIREKALGQEVLRSLKPSDMLARIVQDELTELMGGAGPRHLATASRPPTMPVSWWSRAKSWSTSPTRSARSPDSPHSPGRT